MSDTASLPLLQSLIQDVRRYFESFLDLILPNQCYVCGRFDKEVVCKICLTQLPIAIRIVEFSFGVEKAISVMAYQGSIRKLLSYIKFEQKAEIAKILSVQLPLIFSELPFSAVDYWIPVPIHPNRYRKRGYNQVMLIFESLLRQNGVDFSTVVLRKKDTPPLFELDKETRAAVLDDAFALAEDCPVLENKSVVILDDILTSGATIKEIAHLLRSHHVRHIYALTLCYG